MDIEKLINDDLNDIASAHNIPEVRALEEDEGIVAVRR